jgi:hypothetical protein
MYDANFSLNEILKLIEIQNIFIQEIKEIELKFGNDLYKIGDENFLNSREQYRKRFDIYKYKIFSFVKIENESLLRQEISLWKSLICEKSKEQQVYFWDLKSLETYINNIIPGSSHSTSNRIKWSLLSEFGFESGYEKLRVLYEIENDKETKEHFRRFLIEYDLISMYKLQIQEIIINEDFSEKMNVFIKRIEEKYKDKNKIEELLIAFVDFISFQKISEERIDILIEIIHSKLEEMNYS